MVNQVTQRYIDECLADGSTLRRAAVDAVYPPDLTKAYGKVILPRPLFAQESDLRRASEDLVAFYDLLYSLPDRIFDGDFSRFCAALGMDELRTRLAAKAARQRPPLHARADMIYDGTSFQLLECNTGSELGGTDLAEFGHVLHGNDEFRSFAERNNASFVDTGAELARLFTELGRTVSGDREPTIAVLAWDNALVDYAVLYNSFKEMTDRIGLDVRLAEVSQVVNRDGKLYLNGDPIDVALRYFYLEHVAADPQGEEKIEPIYQAAADGGTVLFATMQTWPYAYKDPMAMLSDTRNRGAFTADEATLIDRVLPWTRVLVDGKTEADGETVDLAAYCRANQQTLVLKPHAGMGAVNTTTGWGVSADEWREAVDSALGAGYVVQRAVHAMHEPIVNPETGEVEPWWPIWGMFVTKYGYTGNFIRAQPAEQGAVVGYRFKPCGTIGYTVPDDEPVSE